jgi:hypothetical protein
MTLNYALNIIYALNKLYNLFLVKLLLERLLASLTDFNLKLYKTLLLQKSITFRPRSG